MRALGLLLIAGCVLPPTPPEPCENVSDYAPCAQGEIAEQRCVFGVVYACEPSIATCYGPDVVGDQCPVAVDGGALRPELLGAHWMSNGWCYAGRAP